VICPSGQLVAREVAHSLRAIGSRECAPDDRLHQGVNHKQRRSALVRITDSSRTSRDVRKVPAKGGSRHVGKTPLGIAAKRACKGYASALARSFGSMFTELRRGTESYPAPDPGAGAGLSGAPPTETGPTGLGSEEIIFRDVPTTRARVFECGMLEVVNGVTALCRASACAASEES
jgi:hypothetical protein